MHETNRERIRRAVDECLSGMDGRPSLEKRVLARAKGERRGPGGSRWRWRWRCW